MKVRSLLCFRLFLISSIVISAWNISAAQFQYTRSTDLPSIRISYDDLDALLSKCYRLAQTANASITNSEAKDSLKIAFDQQEIKTAGHALSGTTRLPKTLQEYDYDFAMYDAPVASIQINLSDSYRKIYVSGTSADEVEAVFTQLERGFLEHSVNFTGRRFRLWCSAILNLVFILGAVCSAAYGLGAGWKKWPLVFVLSVAGMILLFTLPFERWLPGMAAFKDDASFIIRRAPEISFVSLVIGVIAIPLGILVPMWLNKKSSEKPSTQPHAIPPVADEDHFID